MANRQVVVFVGAGFSIAAGLPSASAIADRLFTLMNSPPSLEQRRCDLSEMATQFESQFGRIRLALEVEAMVGTTSRSDLSAAHILLARLVKLGFVRDIITTNYDMLLEDACHEVGAKPRVISNRDQLSLHLSGEVPAIFKIHGDFNTPAQLVLTQRDFQQWALRPEVAPLVAKVKDLLATKSVLFIGYGIRDFNVLQSMLEVSASAAPNLQRLHYAAMHSHHDCDNSFELLRGYNIRAFHAPDNDALLHSLFMALPIKLKVAHLVFNYPDWYPDQQARYGGIETFISILKKHTRHHEPVIESAYSNDMLRSLFATGLATTTSPTYPSSYFFFRAAAQAAVHSLINRRQFGTDVPDVVHMHFLPLAPLAEAAGFPTLCTSHSLLSTDLYFGRGVFDGTASVGCRYEVEAVRNAETRAAMEVNHLTSLTNSHSEELRRVGAGNITKMPVPFAWHDWPVEIEPQRARVASGLPEAFTISYVGRPDRRKGIETLIGACNRLAAAGRKFHLLFVGYGLFVNSRELRVGNGRVRFDIGPMVDAAVRISTKEAENADKAGVFYAASDVVVVPSLYEPMGYVVLEAMARGRTVIAAKTGGIVEAVDDEVDGLLFTAGDVAELVHRIERTMDEPELRRRLAAAARKRIERLPHAHEVVAQWDDMYLKVAATVSSASGTLDAGLEADIQRECDDWMASGASLLSLYSLAVQGCRLAQKFASDDRFRSASNTHLHNSLFRSVAAAMHKSVRRHAKSRAFSSQAIYECMADLELAYLNSEQIRSEPVVLDPHTTQSLMNGWSDAIVASVRGDKQP